MFIRVPTYVLHVDDECVVNVSPTPSIYMVTCAYEYAHTPK